MRDEPRNFDCPETEERCVDARCTVARCCKRELDRAATIREAANKQQRIKNAKVWEIIGPLIRLKRPGKR